MSRLLSCLPSRLSLIEGRGCHFPPRVCEKSMTGSIQVLPPCSCVSFSKSPFFFLPQFSHLKKMGWNFPGGPVNRLRLLASTAGGTGSIPGLGTKILHVLQHVQKKKFQKRDGPASVNMHAAQLIVCQLLS